MELLAKLSGLHFDVAITELLDVCPFAIFHRIGVPTKLATIALPWFPMTARRFGIPTFSSFVPSQNIVHFLVFSIPFLALSAPLNAPFMTFWERTINFYNDFYEWAFEFWNADEFQVKII